MEKIISAGAEAEIIHKGKFIIKHRISKGYRHPELDKKLIKQRTKSESKLLEKASSLANVPKPFFLPVADFTRIKMPFIEGKKLSEFNLTPKLMSQVGKEVAKLHDNNIIHGDLTTSNMILSKGKVYIIDFGLGFISSRLEDKAVDLHLLKQALEAKHFQNHLELYQSFIKAYNPKEKTRVLEQLKKVEARGRYRH